MSKLRTLRAFVSERLTAAAEEIFVQFERTIAEYEEELCRSQKENQRKQQLLDAVLNPGILLAKSGERVQIPSSSPPNLGLNQEITETAQIKEEPEELSLSQEEEQQPGFVPEFSAVCVKTEESSLHQQTEHREETQEEDISSEPHFHFETEELTEHSSDTDNDDDDDWKPSIRLAVVQMETETGGNHDNQVQNRDRSTAAQNSGQSSEYKSVPGTSAAVNNEDTLGTDEGSEGKKHQCPFCMKTFLGNSYLQTHMRVHTGERPYVCSICEKTFNQKSNLKTHLRTHTGEKPYSCIVCHKKFAQNHYLRTHMRTHTGERPYECSTCQRTFAEKGTLKTHMKTHTGERPFSCPLCNLKFTESYTLKTHMQTHNMQFSLS